MSYFLIGGALGFSTDTSVRKQVQEIPCSVVNVEADLMRALRMLHRAQELHFGVDTLPNRGITTAEGWCDWILFCGASVFREIQ